MFNIISSLSQDWVSPYSCKLVNYQTAHSALVEVNQILHGSTKSYNHGLIEMKFNFLHAQGEYIDCVEENFKVQIR